MSFDWRSSVFVEWFAAVDEVPSRFVSELDVAQSPAT